MSRIFPFGFFVFIVNWLAVAIPMELAAADAPPPVSVPQAVASSEKEMQAYDEIVTQTDTTIRMIPIPGGTFVMGSPSQESERSEDEGPQHTVEISPFWMSECEITWEAYDIWGEKLDILRREIIRLPATPRDALSDAVTRPTEPYTDMSFNMGRGKRPAICMTQHAARTYCQWLTAKTGRYYRLPTEAEWEYACRAGTTTAYSFGDDPEQLDKYAWYLDNSQEKTHPVKMKAPNPWGLYDMHGNVSEWVLDQYSSKTYTLRNGRKIKDPLVIPKTLYPRVVRGGGWDDTPDRLRSAARIASDEDWKQQDPQSPKSIWYHTDALSVGFRIVRPLREPSEEEKAAKWEKTSPIQRDPPE